MRAGEPHAHEAIRGDGLVLRPATEDDLDLLCEWFADPDGPGEAGWGLGPRA